MIWQKKRNNCISNKGTFKYYFLKVVLLIVIALNYANIFGRKIDITLRKIKALH